MKFIIAFLIPCFLCAQDYKIPVTAYGIEYLEQAYIDTSTSFIATQDSNTYWVINNEKISVFYMKNDSVVVDNLNVLKTEAIVQYKKSSGTKQKSEDSQYDVVIRYTTRFGVFIFCVNKIGTGCKMYCCSKLVEFQNVLIDE